MSGDTVQYASAGGRPQGIDQDILRAGRIIASQPGAVIGYDPENVQRPFLANFTELRIGGVTVITPARVLQNVTGGPDVEGARVYRATTQGLTDGVRETLHYSDASYDVGGLWNPAANNRLTVPSAGRWAILARVNCTALTMLRVELRLNGTDYVSAVISSNDHGALLTVATCTVVADVLELAAADYVQVVATVDGAGNNTVAGSANNSLLMWKVGT